MGRKNRGSGTHGHGSSKKRRGAGSKGGRGKAGLGKKAKHKKVTYYKEGEKDKGFSGKDKDVNTINIMQIDQKIDSFIEEGFAEEKDGKIIFNAEKAGYDKVLGKGEMRSDIKVIAPSFSKKAEEKLEDYEISE